MKVVYYVYGSTICCMAVLSVKAQWLLTGNSLTNPLTNYLGTADAKDLVLKTNNIERLRINSTGGLSINSSVPLNPAISLFVNGRIVTKTSVDSDLVNFINDQDNVSSGYDILWMSYGKYQPNDAGLLTVSSPNKPGEYSKSKFTVRANGKVGIGECNLYCPTCNDYRLFVKDGIRTEKIKVDIATENGWADYVFKDDYKLIDLKNLETYIKENKHLPEVPTTEEAIKNGIELKEMNILLLKKVEELTIYLINQNKKIEELEKKIISK